MEEISDTAIFIAEAIDANELLLARKALDGAISGGSWESHVALVKQLAATVYVPNGTVIVGSGLHVWKHPYDMEGAWRCGDCEETGRNLPRETAWGSALHHAFVHNPIMEVLPVPSRLIHARP